MSRLILFFFLATTCTLSVPANSTPTEQTASTQPLPAANATLENRVGRTHVVATPLPASPIANEKEKNRDYSSPEWVGVYVNTVLTLATGGLFVFTFFLWRSTNQLVKDGRADANRQADEVKESLRISTTSADAATMQSSIAREALERANRPWVGVGRDVTVRSLLHFGATEVACRVNITIKNLGQSAATGIVDLHRLNVVPAATAPNTLVEDFSYWQPTKGFGFTLLPGESHTFSDVEITFPIASLNVFTAAPVSVWYAGCISYWDEFSKQHRSTFTFRYMNQMPGEVLAQGQVNGRFELFGVGWSNT